MAIDLSKFTRTGQRLKPPRIVLYGVGGIGKTVWASHAPNPYFLFTEEGQGMLNLSRLELREGDPVLKTWDELRGGVEALHDQEHEYETVVIDTLDFAEALVWKALCQKHKKDGIEGFGYGKGYTYAVEEARRLLDGLDALRNDRNMAVILLCHAKAEKFEPPDQPTYHQYTLRLHEKLASVVHDWADCVLFANYRTAVVKDDEGFGRERARAVGVGDRVLYTEKRPPWVAKNHFGLPPELPLDWMAFQNALAEPMRAVSQQESVKPTATNQP